MRRREIAGVLIAGIVADTLLFRGDKAVLRALPYRKGEHGTLLMPGVLSRKKQLLPEVIAALA